MTKVPWGDLTPEQRGNLTEEEYKQYPPEERRSCRDCGHMVGYISWWCSNPEAIKHRGTRIPGVCLCPYWKPEPSKPPQLKTGVSILLTSLVGILFFLAIHFLVMWTFS